MIQPLWRALLVLALVVGGLAHAPMAAAATDGQMMAAASPVSDDGGCDGSTSMTRDCLASCAVGCALLCEEMPAPGAAFRYAWSADDQDASGMLPTPALTPPRL